MSITLGNPLAKYSQGTKYGITITLKPQFYDKDLKEQYNLLYYDLDYLCLHNHHKYHVVIEVTEKGNIHGHGIVMSNHSNMQKLEKEIKDNSECIGFIALRTITDIKGWSAYCSKSYEKTYELVKAFGSPMIMDNPSLL